MKTEISWVEVLPATAVILIMAVVMTTTKMTTNNNGNNNNNNNIAVNVQLETTNRVCFPVVGWKSTASGAVLIISK